MAGGNLALRTARLFESLIARNGDKRVYLRIDRVDLFQAGAHDLDRRELSRFEQRPELRGGLKQDFGSSHGQNTAGLFIQNSLSRRNRVVEREVAKGAQIVQPVFESGLDGAQAIVGEIRSLEVRHIAENFDGDCGLRGLCGRSRSSGERK
jgi:hypothetical protein